MSDILPRPNLPEQAEQWARVAQAKATGVRKVLKKVDQNLKGYNRSNAAITADLARRIQTLTGAANTLEETTEQLEETTTQLEQTASDLQDAFEALPVPLQARAHGDDFDVPSEWTTRASAKLVVPPGKTRANIIVSGQARVADAGFSSGGGGGTPGPTPDSYTVTSAIGETVTLQKNQLQWASSIIGTANSVPGVGKQGAVIALMTAMVESVFRMYANSNVPGSLNYPHDAVGSDHDSLGLFQQRPSMGWGTTAELMNANYNTRAFLGGPSGPNAGNPPGLLDISGWENMSYGQAAQAVQVSAFPGRYENWKNAMIGLYDTLMASGTGNRFIWPFPLNLVTSEYGPRTYPYEGFHQGIDFAGGAAAAGKPIIAAADGIVVISEYGSGWGNHVRLSHSVPEAPGGAVSTLYAHMVSTPLVSVGTSVKQGDVLGYVGNTGNSFGAHLHFETWEGVVFGTHINPRDFMNKYAQGGGGGGTVPGTPTTSFSRVRSRLVIGNMGSIQFMPSWDDIGQYGKNLFFPRWGRTFNVTPGDTIDCDIQFRADRPVTGHNDTYADVVVFGVFSP